MHRDSNDLKELRDVTFKKILRFEEILNSREDQTKRDQSRGDHTKIDPKSTDYIFKVSGMSNRRLFDQKCAEFGSAQLFLIQLYEQTIIDFWQSLTSKLLKQLGANELRIIESMTKLVLPRGQSS